MFEEARRYFVVAEKDEIEENEFNLNLPRYVETFEREEEIDLSAALRELALSAEAAASIRTKLDTLLKFPR